MKKVGLFIIFMLFSHIGFVEARINKDAVSQKVMNQEAVNQGAMNQERMESIIKGMALESKGEKGVVEFVYHQVRMYLVSDVKHDRMRIIVPIIEYKKLTRTQIDLVLESNFHKSLDARYAVREGVLYAAYIHPLSDLSEAHIKSALAQVANLALTFGKEYTSGFLQYGDDKENK